MPNELSDFMRAEIQLLYEEYQELNKKVKLYDQKIKTLYQQSAPAQRIGKIEGVGPLIATAILALGDMKVFKNGRHFAAFLGLVPREYSSGNKQRLGGISKRGNSYLRCLLVHGARSVLIRVKSNHDSKSLWLKRLLERRGMHRACCALANKMARVIWAVMTKETAYIPASLPEDVTVAP